MNNEISNTTRRSGNIHGRLRNAELQPPSVIPTLYKISAFRELDFDFALFLAVPRLRPAGDVIAFSTIGLVLLNIY